MVMTPYEDLPVTEARIDPADWHWIGLKEVMRSTGLTRHQIRHRIKAQKFPAPHRGANRRLSWRQADIDQWMIASMQ